VITSLKNPKVAATVRLKKRALRESDRRFLVEGVQGLREAIASGAIVDALFHRGSADEVVEAARRAGVETIEVSEDVMAKLTSTVTPQGVVAVVRFVDVRLEEIAVEPACVAVLHSVRDPGNAGTVMRSADAAGADAVVFSASSVDVYNPKAVRASAGSLFHLPVVRAADTTVALEELRSRGCRVYAMDAGGEADLYELDLTRPTAFVFGNEAWGLPPEVASLADDTVRVPIRGRAESLNLAAAATVCLFEWARQLREGRRVVLESVIASAAHDIRSPLTAMKGFGYALATRWDQMAEEQRTMMLEGIVYDTDRLTMIVRQLTDAARVVVGAMDLFPERVDVRALVEKVARSAARDPDRPPVVWEGQDRPVAFVDPDRLQLVMEAFVEAEVWWAREGPIRVTARRTDGRLQMEAFRAGTELSEEDAVELFQPRAPGTGAGSKIGLFVAHGVAEAQGGTMVVEVADGGLRFRLDVPAGEGEPTV
jgi:RNA methyltransferase, TrmH family